MRCIVSLYYWLRINMKNLILLPIIGTAILLLLPISAKSRVRDVALFTSVLTLLETIRLFLTLDRSIPGFQHMLEFN
jgi:NADH:ubiquinone oxidoreductase subunit 4 (subunit M)